MPSTESKVYRRYSADLVTAIAASNPSKLASRLYARSLIEENTQDEVDLPVNTAQKRANIIVTAVGRKIETDPRLFHRFLKVLNNESKGLQELGGAMGDACGGHSTASQSTMTTHKTTPTQPPQSQGQAMSGGHHLQSTHRTSTTSAAPDLSTVTEYLVDLDKSQVYHLGISLGLSLERVKSKSDSAQDTMTFLDEVINAWLQGVDNVSDKGGPSWKTLVAALRSRRLNLTSIANNIEKDHPL